MKYYWFKTNDQPPKPGDLLFNDGKIDFPLLGVILKTKNTPDGHLFRLEYKLIVIVLKVNGSIREFLVSFKKP